MAWLEVPARMGAQFRDRVRPRRACERFLFLVGVVLIASGLFHLAVFLVDGGAWGGAVSWRKPVSFGLSFGLTAATVGWILGRLPEREGLGWAVSLTLGLAVLVEVGLVTMQRWRGVASHFNDAAPFDAAVFIGMAVSIGVVLLATVVVLIWSAISLRGDAAARWAVVVGLLLMLGAGGIGQDMIGRGLQAVENTEVVPAEVLVSPAGSLKLAHAAGLHGIQVLGALAVALGLGGRAAATRRRLMVAASAAYTAAFGVVVTQAYQGRAIADLPLPYAVILAVDLAVLAAIAAAAVLAWARSAGGGAAPEAVAA